MNLMFWKKKTGTGDGAEKLQENPENNSGSHQPDDPGTAGPGTPEKPGLAERVKTAFAAVAARFRKSPARDAGEDESPDAGAQHGPEAAPEGASEGAPDINPEPSKKRLMMGGIAGVLVLSLFGFAVWKILRPSPKHGDSAPAGAAMPHAIRPASGVGAPQAELKTLKEKNAELQAQIDALKKGQAQQQPSNPPARETMENTPLSSGSGELTIVSKDPKAAAASLKEAIEAMNAGSGGYARKPPNK